MKLQKRMSFVPIGPTEPDCTTHRIALAMDWQRKINALLTGGAEQVEVTWIDRPVGYSKLLQPQYASEFDYGFRIIAYRTRQ